MEATRGPRQADVRRWRAWVVMWGSVVWLGCGRGEPPRFTNRVAFNEQKLSELHRQELAAVLANYYATPDQPVLKLPKLDSAGHPVGADPVLEEIASRDRLAAGYAVYRENCSSCHGVTGDGQGPAAEYLNPKPRDYRLGQFKFTSTPRGVKPRRQDLERIVRKGAKGTSMPSFRFLSEDDVAAVVDYVEYLSRRGEHEYRLVLEASTEMEPKQSFEKATVAETAALVHKSWQDAAGRLVMPVSLPPRFDEESIALGQKAFLTKGCAKCHGADGRGQTAENTEENVGPDVWGRKAKAADLTAGMLHGGRRSIDIYRRIWLGINGTPMPAFDQALKDEPETAWHMVHFVLALAEGRKLPPPAIPVPAPGAPAESAAAPAVPGN